ncbi:MAG: heavy metal translocating P-type ATPase [Alkalibacterium sp.]|nr:heavy metal translocating P-type ATPase [Alkalibacterium sp.]
MSKVSLVKKRFKIEGMTCSSCAGIIRDTLTSLNGVISANVNVAAEKGEVEYDELILTPVEIENAVDNVGYKAVMETEESTQKSTLKIEGMTCTSCAGNIEKTIKKLKGIVSVNINFATEKLTVEYDPKIIRINDMQKSVSSIGYELKIEENENADVDEDEVKINKAKKLMLTSAIFSSLIMGLMIIHMFIVPIPGYLPIIAALGIPIVFGTGWHVHVGSWKAIKHGNLNMDVLVTLGSLPPYIIGLMGLFLPLQSFIEMATTIMTFHLTGKYLEARAKGRASQAVKKLLQMGAKTAKVIVDGEEVEMPVKDLQPGDIMVIRPGEKVPTDGVVIEGNGLLDESMVTGESMPVKRIKDDEVIGATINKQGLLKVKVSKVGNDTFLSQVVKMMEDLQGSKVPIQEFADRVTGYFVPAIIILTIATFISFNLFPEFHLGIINWASNFLPWVNPDLTPLTLSFITATAVLVISCPCALGLGTPTALMVGSGMGAENGILIRNGEAIQTFKDVKAIAFDKTGTITKGKPEVTDLLTEQGLSESDFLYYAATMEKGSEHPLGHAIVEKAKSEGIITGMVVDFNALVGMGVKGIVDGQEIIIGNRKLMKEAGVIFDSYENDLVRLEEEAKTAMLLAKNNKLLGIIAVADPIKEESAEAIKAIEAMGIKTAMITGDNQRTADAIAKKVGISHVIAEVLPDGKVSAVKNLQDQYHTVAMVGDGINDAPALKQANIGIAIGTGTDIAIEAADVTLVKGDLNGITSTVKLSRAIFRKIKQNYFWAWFYNAVFIPVAMLGLLHPMIGAAAMAVSSLNVVYNSLRLKKTDISSQTVTG